MTENSVMRKTTEFWKLNCRGYFVMKSFFSCLTLENLVLQCFYLNHLKSKGSKETQSLFGMTLCGHQVSIYNRTQTRNHELSIPIIRKMPKS